MPATLRITDTVPVANREEYVKAWEKFIEEAPEGMKHIGSWRVAYGHALDFMHLWELESMDALDFDKLKVSEDLRKHIRYMTGLMSDSYWSWLEPLRK